MAFTLAGSTLRPLLKASMVSAGWVASTARIWSRPPFLPKAAADLPMGFLWLEDIEPEYASGTAGAGQVSAVHPFRIGLRKRMPSGTEVQDDMETEAQALITLLMTGNVYNGYRRRLRAVRFGEGNLETQARELFYEIVIEFDLEVTTDG